MSSQVRTTGVEKQYHENLDQVMALTVANVITKQNQMDVTLARGEAFRGMVPIAIPTRAKGMTLELLVDPKDIEGEVQVSLRR